jgi:murein L,D-transpeptidase YcbB/YkuD
MIYGDPSLAPKRPDTRGILAEAQNAPSLLRHVEATAAVNPIYAGLRDAAWSQLKLIGGALPDARTMSNLKRARVLPASGRYIIVDAATAQLSMYQDDKVQDSMKVVVGKRSSPTPLLAGTIHYVTFNPYWNIPTDVTASGVAPIVLKRGTKYLKLAEYEVVSDFTDSATVVPPDDIDWQSVAAGEKKIWVRQLPGPRNMMGAMKFGFINDQGIYLHDTPRKNLFAKEPRTFSLGCVRVEDARRLARWLLNREPAPPNDQPEQHVRLGAGVPIFITYLTMQAHAGRLTFAEDVYGLDSVSASAVGEQSRVRVSVAAPGVAADRQ